MRTHNSELVEKVTTTNEQGWDQSKALEAEQHIIPKYQEEVIIDYKAFARFMRVMEMSGVASYQFGYQIALTRFKIRHPKLELKEDPFTDYPSAGYRCPVSQSRE
ncbi:hypothetical protein BHM03_00011663 [Ensete ventricosum]|nr:hypothetical protein BHM03_00011663 [Ensete ventricosum]